MNKTLLELRPTLKRTLGLDGDMSYYYPMLFGRQAVGYPRTVQRATAATIIAID